MSKRKKIRSVGAIQMEVELQSQYAQRLLNDFFPVKSLEGLSIVLRIYGNEAQNKIASQILDEEILQPFLQDLEKKKINLQQQAEEAGIDTNIKFTKPKKINVELTTPRAYDFLRAIMNVDQIVQILTAMWFSRVISDQKFVKEVGKVYRRVRNEAFRIRKLARKVFSELKEQREANEEARKVITEAENEISKQDIVEEREKKQDEIEGLDNNENE